MIKEKINPQEVKKWIINQLYNCDLNYKKKNMETLIKTMLLKQLMLCLCIKLLKILDIF